MNRIVEGWDRTYSAGRGCMWYPDEGLVRFIARFLKMRVSVDKFEVKRKVGRVIDVGCGNGRHVVLFAEQGFDVWGTDPSSRAITYTRDWLIKRDLNATLNVCDGEQLPYAGEFFDVAVCFGVLDHVRFYKAKKIMREIHRVLSPKGLFYVSLRSFEDVEAPGNHDNTCVLDSGYEEGLIQHFFDKSEVCELLRGFEVLDVEVHDERFPAFLGKDKSFNQTSKGVKDPIDLKQPFTWSKYSRWHLGCRKKEVR